LIMPSWSDGEGGGATHAALAKFVGGENNGELLCFASAGNTAQRHWCGLFHAASNGFHEWNRGQCDNELTPWGNEEISVELCVPREGNYDLLVYEEGTHREVARSLARNHPGQKCAVARFVPESWHRYEIRVRLAKGPAGRFHLVVLGGYLGCATSQGSIPFPADGPEVIAVGAVNDFGERAAYSSCGPNSSQPKPDFVAPVPFPSFCRGRPFAGTSAAAPQAAGLAALWWSKYPDWSAGQVRNAMCASARDLGPPGHDYETGYGVIVLPRPTAPAPMRNHNH
jgi:subtilisin family serine protease